MSLDIGGQPGDPYNLERFVQAQNPVYHQVCWELKQGLKMTHWIWFIFPQIKGLSSSAMSTKFAISSLEEAAAYLDHCILETRLRECTELVTDAKDRTLKRILGSTDSLKFQSCMTLFARATTRNEVFKTALGKYFSGVHDPRTLDLL